MSVKRLEARLSYFEALHERLDEQISVQIEQLIRVEFAYYKTLDDLAIERIVQLCRTGE